MSCSGIVDQYIVDSTFFMCFYLVSIGSFFFLGVVFYLVSLKNLFCFKGFVVVFCFCLFVEKDLKVGYMGRWRESRRI